MIKKIIVLLGVLSTLTLMVAPINLNFITSDSVNPILIAEARDLSRYITPVTCRNAGGVWVDPDGDGGVAGVCREDPITSLARRILSWAQTLFAIIAVGAILLGAFMFITASGDESKLKKGRNSILFALIAVFIVAITGWLIAWFQGIAG